jgi:hypothetical protein
VLAQIKGWQHSTVSTGFAINEISVASNCFVEIGRVNIICILVIV